MRLRPAPLRAPAHPQEALMLKFAAGFVLGGIVLFFVGWLWLAWRFMKDF